MKFKMIIALSLVLVMVATLAAPASAKGLKLYSSDIDPGVGNANFRIDKDNHAVVSVSLRNATPGQTYDVILAIGSYLDIGDLDVGQDGRGRFKGTTTQSWDPGTTGTWRIFLRRPKVGGGVEWCFHTDLFPVRF